MARVGMGRAGAGRARDGAPGGAPSPRVRVARVRTEVGPRGDRREACVGDEAGGRRQDPHPLRAIDVIVHAGIGPPVRVDVVDDGADLGVAVERVALHEVVHLPDGARDALEGPHAEDVAALRRHARRPHRVLRLRHVADLRAEVPLDAALRVRLPQRVVVGLEVLVLVHHLVLARGRQRVEPPHAAAPLRRDRRTDPVIREREHRRVGGRLRTVVGVLHRVWQRHCALVLEHALVGVVGADGIGGDVACAPVVGAPRPVLHKVGALGHVVAKCSCRVECGV